MYDKKKRSGSVKAAQSLPPMPARTEQEEIKRAGGYAMDLAMKWLQEGTAPAQIVTHFLKINSPKEQAEVEKIELIKAKKKTIELAEEQDKKYEEVIRAISSYAGKDQEWETIEDEYPEY